MKDNYLDNTEFIDQNKEIAKNKLKKRTWKLLILFTVLNFILLGIVYPYFPNKEFLNGPVLRVFTISFFSIPVLLSIIMTILSLIIAIFPIKSLEFKVKFLSSFRISNLIASCLFFIVFAVGGAGIIMNPPTKAEQYSNIEATTDNIDTIKIGTFYGNGMTYIRSENKQIEKWPNGKERHFNIEWVGAEYTLTPLKKQWGEPDELKCKVTEIDQFGYRGYMNINGYASAFEMFYLKQ